MTLAKVAYLTPADGVDTDAHSQAVWEGVQSFVTKKNLTAVNLAPAEDTDAARKDAVTRAIADGANVIVCSGNEYGTVIAGLVKDNPKVRFLLTDAGMKDSSGKAAVADNVATITYHEEQAGYLAGYALIAGGYYDIGLAAGEQTPVQLRYGYGFLQGVDDAAADLNVVDKVYVTYWYANASAASTESYDEIAHWYSTGTRAVFCCEGGIVQNVLDAAATADGGRVIDVETGSGSASDVLLTSATVDMSGMVADALTKLADAKGKWPSDLSAKTVNYGVAENMIGLSTDNWRFDSYSTDDYRALYDAFKGDTARVSSDITARPTVSVQVRWKNEPAEGE